MFRTKTSVDRHVQELFKKVRDENERNLRCYNIAKLYYQVGEYEAARRYVSSYLEIKNESAGAHKLLGQIYEALEQKENAFAQYKQSLELDGRQDDVILKVCEILADADVGLDINRIKYWVDRASEKLPNHPIVFELKEKMLAADKSNTNDDDLEALITSELIARPSDVTLRVKLIKYYMKKNRLTDALKHVVDVEITHPYRDSIIWYEALCDLLPKCKDIRQSKMPFWVLYISSLERYASLTLREQGNSVNNTIQEATQALFTFDQCLTEAKQQNYDNTTVSTQMFNHMWGQLNYHLACLLMRKVKRDQKNWIEIGRLCSALLLDAIHSTPIDLTSSSVINAKEPIKELLVLWYKEGSYRCSQAAHVLKDCGKDNPKRLMDVIDECCNSTWREYIYRKIFITKSQEQLINKSYFAKSNLPNAPLRLLSSTELKIYDEIAKEIYPASLHHHVWLGIVNRPRYKKNSDNFNIDIYPNQYSHVFPNLKQSVFNLSQTAPDSIGRLDIDAFLNATILCATAIVDEQQRSGFLNPDRLPTLPADLTNTLCTTNQQKWWDAVYKMYSHDENINGNYDELRQEIQRGLEIIRCIGNHGLHLNILIHLARLFHHRAELLRATDKNHSDLLFLQLRYELYWSTAVPLLERSLNNYSIRMTATKLFDYQGKDMNNAEMANALDEGRLILAQRYLRDKQHEQAIDALQVIKSPEASYLQGEIYKTLADELIDSQPRETLTSAIKSQHIIMLTKARNCYYLTLDRLRSPGLNPNHPLNAELGSRIEAIENDLKRIDPDLWRNNDLNRQDYDALSEDSYSSAHSAEQNHSHNFIGNNSTLAFGNISSSQRAHHRTSKHPNTPRNHHQHHHYHDAIELSRNRIQNEARPSPERLDAQLRQLIYAKDNMLSIMMDQMKSLIDSNKSLIDSNKQLDGKLEELRKEFSNFRIESQQKNRLRSTNNIDEQYLTDDDYNDINFTASINNSTLAQPTQLPPPPSIQPIPNNLFAQTQRNSYSSLVYPPPPPPPPPQLGGYFPGGLPFNDLHTQHIQSLYPHGVYPMQPIYPRPPIDQSIGVIPKIPDMLQQGMLQQSLFHSHLFNHLTDYTNTSPQQQQQQQQNHLTQSMPMQMPGTNITQNNQGQKDVLTIPPITPIVKDAPVNKTPPVNVVITSSDTLPTNVSTVQPTLSVTVPPQHRNAGTTQNNPMMNDQTMPHNYQISMPSQAMIPTTVYLPPLSTTLTDAIANTQEKNRSGLNTSIVSAGSHNSSIEAAEVEYDPIPGFVPVIPLPAEIKVRTGEEDEETLFCARAKLFRFVDKEWKDRGVGNVKLLRNKEGKIRLLMRREQVLKICANHFLTPDMNLQAMNNNDKAWIWVANDFADGEVKLEKLCIKFKLVEEAQAFKENFDKAKGMIVTSPEKTQVERAVDKIVDLTAATSKNTEEKSPLVVGGFVFKSQPIIQKSSTNDDDDAENMKKTDETTKTPSKPSPFVGFSFVKNDSANPSPATTLPSSNLFSFVKTSSAPSNIFETPKSSPFTTQITKVPTTFSNDSPSVGQHTPLQRSYNEIFPSSTPSGTPSGVISDIFKSSTATWECSSCYTHNKIEIKNCVACTAPSGRAVSTPVQSTQSNSQKPLSELFKPPVDSWECTMCYVRNSSTNNTCVACNSKNEKDSNSTPSQKSEISSTVTGGLFGSDPTLQTKSKSSDGFKIAGSGTTSTFTFGIPPGTNQNATASATASTFSFGIPSINQQINTDTTNGGFSFKASSIDDKISTDNQTKSLNFCEFGQLNKPNNKEFTFDTAQKPERSSSSSIVSTGSFAFGTPGKNFDFQFQTKSPVKPTVGDSDSGNGAGPAATAAAAAADASEDEVVESEDVYFSPVIPLPDKIEIKTGEEDEETLYNHRAKLFRFDPNTKEWKDRGLGDIKLLRHRETQKLRLIMRRDHTLKLCLNNVVDADLEITPKDDKTWLWSAADFSTGEFEYVTLACRFKTTEIAAEFKQSIESALANAASSDTKNTDDKNITKSASQSSGPVSAQDLQVVYELKVSPEEKDAALKLQLPENFYSYKQKEDCPGCLGCKEPDHPLFDSQNNETKNPTSTNIQQEGTKLSATSVNTESSINFGNATDNQESSKPQTIFGMTINAKDENKSTEKSNFVFGSTSSQIKPHVMSNLFDKFSACSPSENKSKNLTDTTSIFGKPTPGESPSIFGGSGQTTIFNTPTNKLSNIAPTTTATTIAPTSFSTSFNNFGNSYAATYTFGESAKDTPPSFSQLAESVNANTPPQIPTPVSTNLFKSSGNSSTSLFGGTNQSSSIFSGVPQGAKSLFGGSTIKSDSTSTTSSSITPTAAVTPASTTASSGLFSSMTSPSFGSLSGSSILSNKLSTTSSTPSMADNKIFGESPSIFGRTVVENVTPTFGATVKTTESASKTEETFSTLPFLNTDNITTFSSLAVTGTQPMGFKTDPNFSFAGAGQSVFSARNPAIASSNTPASNQNKTPKSTDDDGVENNDNEEYDPHYEPIIPLPDQVEVRTGEEDEEKIFCHRAKLYRYEINTKEWKERGTGEMKLLFHPQHGTYRLLLRREQVHKVVCNLLLTPEIEFQPLKTSDRTWMWAGMNYTDETLAIEKLAVKFKNQELANEFKNAIDKAQSELREKQNNSQSIDKSENEDYKNYRVDEEDDEEEEDDAEEDDGEDEGDDDEDEQHTLMFEKSAELLYLDHDRQWKSFGMGLLKMLYDSDIFGARIIFEIVPGDVISSTIISIETVMEKNGYDCTWAAIDSAIDPPMRRALKAHFSVEDYAHEMYINFQDGQECAKQADISEAAYYDYQEEP